MKRFSVDKALAISASDIYCCLLVLWTNVIAPSPVTRINVVDTNHIVGPRRVTEHADRAGAGGKSAYDLIVTHSILLSVSLKR
jgi:hypothetical protein